MSKPKQYSEKKKFIAEADEDFSELLFLAEQGDLASQTNLAEIFREGSRVPKNDEQAFKWALAAALQGHSHSMFHIALHYFQGSGVEPNKGEAINWLSRLAYPETTEARNNDQMFNAMCQMATIYYAPGEPQDLAAAYGWLLLAICYGQPWDVEETPFNYQILNKQRDTLALMEQVKAKFESELTAAQRAKGQQMAAELYRPIEYEEEEE